jgi:hypothetical protein
MKRSPRIHPDPPARRVDLLQALVMSSLWLVGRQSREAVAETWAAFRQPHGRRDAADASMTPPVEHVGPESAPRYWTAPANDASGWPASTTAAQLDVATELIGTGELSASSAWAPAQLEAPTGELAVGRLPDELLEEPPQVHAPSSTAPFTTKAGATNWIQSIVIFVGVSAVALGVAVSFSRRLIGLTILGAILIGLGATLISEYVRRSRRQNRTTGQYRLRPRAPVPVHVVRDRGQRSDADGIDHGPPRTGSAEAGNEVGGLVVAEGAGEPEGSESESVRTVWRQYKP